MTDDDAPELALRLVAAPGFGGAATGPGHGPAATRHQPGVGSAPVWSAPGSQPGMPPGPPPIGGPAPYWVQPKTNGLAIASLVLGCAQFIFCGVLSLAAVITGHIARRQIKQSEGMQTGRGLATAGLILGYIGIVVSIGFIAFIIALFVFGDSFQQRELRNEAHDLVDHAELLAAFNSEGEVRNVRNPEVLAQAYNEVHDFDEDYEAYVATGVPIQFADLQDWEDARWQIEFHGDEFSDTYVCLQIPPAGGVETVTNGQCSLVPAAAQ